MAAGIDCARIEAVARTVVAAEAGYNNLKQELVQAIVEFFCWRDVFVSLLATASLSSMGFCLGHSASRNGRKRRQMLWLLVHCRH